LDDERFQTAYRLTFDLREEPGALVGAPCNRRVKSLPQAGEVRRNTSGPSVLPEAESPTEQEHGGKAQVGTNTPNPMLRKARVIWPRLDCLNPRPQRWKRTLLATACKGKADGIGRSHFRRPIEKTLLPTFNRGDQRRTNPAYKALLNAARRAGDRGDHEMAKHLRQEAQTMPSRDPEDPNFRRLKYVRYADDTLLGFSGSRSEAEEIKCRIGAFLRDELRLELSAEKTLITHARTRAARFLGFEVMVLDADHKHDRRGQRCINGAVRLKVPRDVIVERCRPYMRKGKAVHRPERLADDDFSIVKQYQAEYRGFVQYYLPAMNAHRLRRVYRVMQTSLLGTLANKHKTKVGKIRRRMRKMVRDRGHTLKALVVEKPRGDRKKPLVAMFGGISLAWNKHVLVLDRPKQVYSGRSDVVQRLLAEICELCGSVDGPFEVHHVRRLADLDRPGQKEKPLWVKRMASRQRKTLVTCLRCHQDIHRDRSGWREKTKHWKAG